MEENGGYDSVNRHWGFLPTLWCCCWALPVSGRPPAPFLELSSNLCPSGLLQSLPLYFGPPGKATKVSLACILFTDAFEALLGSFDSVFLM